MERIKELLKAISDVLEASGAHSEVSHADFIRRTLAGPDEALRAYLVSHALWGGSGSIADSALIDHPRLHRTLRYLLIALAREQRKLGLVNERMDSWVFGFDGLVYWLYPRSWLHALKQIF